MTTPSQNTQPNTQPPIVVPLDGSELAERALPAAERLARALRRPLLLVNVIAINTWAYLPPSAVFPPATYQEVLKEEDRASQHYLRDVSQRLAAKELSVHIRSLRGDPASAIIDTARGEAAPLIVMASHGHTGLARFALGSVADRVVSYGRVPTLLVRALGESMDAAQLERAIVPLDGSDTAERALSLVAQLAGDPLREVTLIQVVNPEVRAGQTDEARHYLEGASQRLEQRLAGKACAVTTQVLYGNVDEQIIDAATRQGGIIIMGTHGRSGIERWAYGSVASHVLRGTRTPLLLVHTLAQV